MGRDLKRISMRIDGTCLRNFESTPVCAHLLLGFSAYNRQNVKDKKGGRSLTAQLFLKQSLHLPHPGIEQ